MDPTTFPLREGFSVPRELVAVHADALLKTYGAPINSLAVRGGISVYELLLLQPAPAGTSKAAHDREIHEFTLTQATHALARLLAAFHAKREADAEAAMLAMMEEGAT